MTLDEPCCKTLEISIDESQNSLQGTQKHRFGTYTKMDKQQNNHDVYRLIYDYDNTNKVNYLITGKHSMAWEVSV